MQQKLLYITNHGPYFLLQYLGLLLAAQAKGYQIHIACPTSAADKTFLAYGFHHHHYPLSRSGINPFNELKTFFCLGKLIYTLKPDLIHNLRIKSLVYGNLLARFFRTNKVISSVTGLGYVFVSSQLKARLLQPIIKSALRLALNNNNSVVIFENPDDQAYFENNKLTIPRRSRLILGSGVDTDYFTPLPEPNVKKVTVTLAGRFLKTKGIYEYIEAAKLLKSQFNVRFLLVGYPDLENPDSIDWDELFDWQQNGLIDWLPWQQDMLHLFRQTHIVCLPSYREGLSKFLLEAAACAKPIVTTDVPGCRDVIKNDVNGLLVPKGNSAALASAISVFLKYKNFRHHCGHASREKALKDFDLRITNKQTLDVYAQDLTLAPISCQA